MAGNLYADSIVVLDAKVWAYVKHFKIVPRDWNDWDVSSLPVLLHTRGGIDLMSVAPKDGHLYGFDWNENRKMYRRPVTTIANVDGEFVPGKPVHCCPGVTGGAEWNGPAYDPQINLIAIGEVDWRATVTRESDQNIEKTETGKIWSGVSFLNPYNLMGKPDSSFTHWGGWVYAVDADSGKWKWRIRNNFPIVSGVTPTADGAIFFGDVGGNFYDVGSATGAQLFAQQFRGAVVGGAITYKANGSQRIVVATGVESILWATDESTLEVVVLGL